MTKKRYIWNRKYIHVEDTLTGDTIYLGPAMQKEKLINTLNRLFEKSIGLEGEILQIKDDLKKVLPILLAIDFKVSLNECEALNRLCEFVDDDFIVGMDCDKND